jgi:hypothetical protein
MQVAVIPANPNEMITFRDVKGGDTLVDELRDLVAGEIQSLSIRNYAMTMYVNETHRVQGLPRNHRATVLAGWAEDVRADDILGGDVVLVGPMDSDGNDLPIVDVHKAWLIRFDNEQSELAGVGD